MEHYEMVEKLMEKADITAEEAKAALESCEWDMLDATIQLEKEGKLYAAGARAETPRDEVTFAELAETEQPKEEETSGKRQRGKVGTFLRKLVRIGKNNSFVITRNGKELMSVPVLAGFLLLIQPVFWLTLITLAVGLFFHWEYSFRGSDLGKENINNGIREVTDAAQGVIEQMKDSADKKD